MVNIPIKKLKDGRVDFYYPLSVGESVVLTHPITVEHDIGRYKTGDEIDKLTSFDELFVKILQGDGGSSFIVDDTLLYNKETKILQVNTDVIATKEYVDDAVTQVFRFKGTAKYVSEDKTILVDADDIEHVAGRLNVGHLYIIFDETAKNRKEYVSTGKIWELIGFSSNDYTDEEKEKLAGIANGATKVIVDDEITSGGTNPVQGGLIYTALEEKVDKEEGKGLSSNDFTDSEKTKVSQSSIVTETGSKINLELDSSTYKLVAKLYDKNNNLISQSEEIDLPIEELIVDIEYDDTNKKLIITLKSGKKIEIPLSGIISGLATTKYVDDKCDKKVDKEAGKGLSTNDYTTEEKNKLSGIAEGATKVIVDKDLSTSSTNPVQNSKITEKIEDIYSYFTTDKDLASISISGTWTIYNQSDVQTSTSTSTSLSVEKGYKVSWEGKWKWVNNDNQKKPTRCSGTFGTTLPDRDTYQDVSVPEKKTDDQTYAESIFANKSGLVLSGTSIQNAKVVKASGEYVNTASVSVKFKSRYYIGYSTTNAITGDIIKSLSKHTDLTTTKALTETGITTASNQYLVYAYPQVLGELTSIIQDGATPVFTAFTKKTNITVTNAAGLDVTYIAYVSNNVGAFSNSKLAFS